MTRLIVLFICATFFVAKVYGIYLPGVMPNEFSMGDPLDVKAVKLTSSKTQLPYRYYDLEFCRPETEVETAAENIGEILRGDRIVNTPYLVNMAKDIPCVILCHKELKKQSASAFQSFISEDYSIHLSIDNLIGATLYQTDTENTKRYVFGFKLGVSVAGTNYIYNHLRFRLQYNTVDNNKHRFVGFEIEPMSIAETFLTSSANTQSCQRPQEPIPISKWKTITEDTKTLQFSYEILWEPSSIRWASRWDIYLRSEGGQVHWFSIVNSLVVVMFLTTIISLILVRTLRKDIAKYNRDDDAEDILEESGWKLVHGDVFRPPRYIRLLTALFGSGVQIFSMVFVTIFFAMLGMLSPTSRGALMTAAIFTYVFMGLFAGYYAGRMYKTMRGLLWKSTAVFTGLLFPTLVLMVGSVLNSFIWYKRSSAAIPFTTILAILALWLGVSLPLVYSGFFFGYRKKSYELPVRTNQIPRAVPPSRLYQNMCITTLLAGALPFGSVFIEVFFVYNAIWESHFYYLFGFLFTVFIILIISCAQVTIVVTYFQLCNEDYRWWWRSFIASGGPAVYLFAYSAFYYWTRLNITQFVPTVVYFGYVTMMTMAFWLLTGTIGFISTFVFLQYIYSAIKID